MSNPYPHELAIDDVYFTPFLAIFALSFFATLLTVMLLNKLKLSRYFYAPQYVFLAIMVLYALLIDRYLIRF
jgi:hypothetical protein